MPITVIRRHRVAIGVPIGIFAGSAAGIFANIGHWLGRESILNVILMGGTAICALASLRWWWKVRWPLIVFTTCAFLGRAATSFFLGIPGRGQLSEFASAGIWAVLWYFAIEWLFVVDRVHHIDRAAGLD